MSFCNECHSEFWSMYSLKRHQNVKHNPDFKGFVCNKCSRSLGETGCFVDTLRIQLRLTFLLTGQRVIRELLRRPSSSV